MNPLKSILGTIISGIVLAVVIIFAMSTGEGNPIEFTIWFHTIVGIAWIGLLYYFNFVQVPAMNAAAADTGGPGPAAIGKYVAPRALLWFRYAALLTWLSGFAALGKMGITAEAMTLSSTSVNVNVLGIGAWLGTIMLINVWVFIWPNQKKVLGMVDATDEQKARAKGIAFTASRINTMLSIPMLLGMTAYGHGLPF